jgi:molybdate transport system substrate-binding protein
MIYVRRRASINGFYLICLGAIGLLIVLGLMLWIMARPHRPQAHSGTAFDVKTADGGMSSTTDKRLLVYCAAGIRPPMEQVAADYEQEYGMSVQLQYGGSNTLLSQIEVARSGDLYLAADDHYLELARKKGLVKEVLPLATMRPVIAVQKGNPKAIRAVDDLLRDDVKTALGNPEQAAIGKTTRKLLVDSGHWQRLEAQVTRHGVFKPTVPEVANDIKLGSVDAGIIWDTTLALYPELEAIRVSELDAGLSHVSVGVLTSSQSPAASLSFARYLTARDKGQVGGRTRDHVFLRSREPSRR